MQKSSMEVYAEKWFRQPFLKKRRTVPMGVNSLSRICWDCSYHIIFIPKYRVEKL